MDKIIATIILVISFSTANAQYAYFGTRGTIAFDKVLFTKARIKSMSQQMDQSTMMRFGGGGFGGGFNMNDMPESTTQKMILYFDENSTVLFLDPNAENNNNPRSGNNAPSMNMRGNAGGGSRGGNMGSIGAAGGRGGQMGQSGERRGQSEAPRGRVNNNSKVLFQDLKKNTSAVQLEIDDKYTITDTLNNITWRFTDEYRDIAGFECRRVNGATADSLYLVAFYTDQIPVSAGPGLSSGLPGMILGLAIPEMHIQYWATKVDYSNDTTPTDWKDKKATAITLDDFVKNFGRSFQRGRDSNTGRRQIQEQLIY